MINKILLKPKTRSNNKEKLKLNSATIERIKFNRDMIQKHFPDNKINIDLSLGTFHLVSSSDKENFVDLPISLYEVVRLKISKSKKDFEILADCSLQIATLYCDKEFIPDAKKIIANIVSNYFHNSIIDSTNKLKKLDSKTFPLIEDLENYSNKEKELYRYAFEGFKKKDDFKCICTGNPGTGKTWFAKILSKFLIENKIVDFIMICNLRWLHFICDMFYRLDVKHKILFIIDEMEKDAIDRSSGNMGAQKLLKILDGMDTTYDIRLLGISNLPQIMDRALFRPGRIDMLICSEKPKLTEEYLFNIFKSLSYKITHTKLKELSKFMYKQFTEIMPISFYSHAIRLWDIYKEWDCVSSILDVFYSNKGLFQYDDGLGYQKNNRIGFMEEDNCEVAEARRTESL